MLQSAENAKRADFRAIVCNVGTCRSHVSPLRALLTADCSSRIVLNWNNRLCRCIGRFFSRQGRPRSLVYSPSAAIMYPLRSG